MSPPKEDRKCPKCSGQMRLLEETCALTKYHDPKNDPPKSFAVDPGVSFPLEVYHCEKCRFVELYAG